MLPIYDALFHEPRLKHILVRHEQGAGPRGGGLCALDRAKPGVVLATSGPGATNIVTPLGRRANGFHSAGGDHRPGADPPDRVGRLPGMRHGGHHAPGHQAQRAGQGREETWLARSTKPSTSPPQGVQVRCLSTSPRTCSSPAPPMRRRTLHAPRLANKARAYAPRRQANAARVREAVELIASAQRPILYTGGGVINAGPVASERLRAFARATGAPVTSTLMGLGAYPADGPQWLGMLGMHGAYEANHAMHDCDVMVCVGARFDDRVTGRLDAFSPGSKKIHIDIDPSSIGKIVKCDVALIGDAGEVLGQLLDTWGGREGGGLGALVVARSRRGGRGAASPTRRPYKRDQAAVTRWSDCTPSPATRKRTGAARLCLDRGRSAPDVGGAVFPLPSAQSLDDLGRARHHGLRPAGGGGDTGGASRRPGHRHRRRSECADDHAGNLHRGSVRRCRSRCSS